MNASTAVRFLSAPVLTSLSCVALATSASPVHAADTDWTSPIGNFCDPGNWSPTAPGPDDHAWLGRTSMHPTAMLNCQVDLAALDLVGGASLHTGGQRLDVTGWTHLDQDIGEVILTTQPFATNPFAWGYRTRNLWLENGATLFMNSGSIVRIEDTLFIDTGSTVAGMGTLEFADVSIPPRKLIRLTAGTIRTGAESLSINALGNGYFDLDGDDDPAAAFIEVIEADADLSFSGPLNDPFGGTMSIGSNNTLSFDHDLAVDGVIRFVESQPALGELDGPFFDFFGGGELRVEAGTAQVDGAAAFGNGGRLVSHADTELAFNVALVDMAPGSEAVIDGIVDLGVTRWDGTSISGAGFLEASTGIDVMNNDVLVDMPAGVFDMDGPGGGWMTIDDDVRLTVNASAIDEESTDGFDGDMDSHGILEINTPGPWEMEGEMNLFAARVEGSPMHLDSAALVQVHAGPGPSVIASSLQVQPATAVTVDLAATLELRGTTTTLDGNDSAVSHLTGAGGIELHGDLVVASDSRIDVGWFDWDATPGRTTTIEPGAHLILAPYAFQVGGDTHDGDIVLMDGASLSVSPNAATWAFAGTMTLGPDAHLLGADLDNTGRIEGSGNIVGVNIRNQGGLAPDGLLATTWADFEQWPDGALEIDIVGPATQNAYDRLLVNNLLSGGNVQLSGALQVTLAPGFVPAYGEAYAVVSGGSISGVFDTVDAEDFEISYEPAPSPGAWATVVATYVGCPADVNGDGTVDVGDLVDVVVAWGSTDPAADTNHDGVVDVEDLVHVISAWGACP